MYLDCNEAAFDYASTASGGAEVTDKIKLREQMADFFVNYISNDSIGRLATEFLVNSDTFGINSAVCESIAIKHMGAVDFPKTGKPAERLSKEERSIRKPDFLEREHEPTYKSNRLNGELFRRIKGIDLVLESTIGTHLVPPPLDPSFILDNITDEEWKIARENYSQYESKMEHMLCR